MDRSVLVAIGWSRIAPKLGVPFDLPPGWEESTGYFYEDNRVRDAVGASDDREAFDKLMAIIKAHKAGTLVKLELMRRAIQLHVEYTDNQGVSAYVKQALIAALAAALGSFTFGTLTVGSEALLQVADAERLKMERQAIVDIGRDIDSRIAKRGGTSSSSSSRSQTSRRPQAFGSKN